MLLITAPQEFLLWADAGTGEVGLTGLLDTPNADKFLIAKRGIPVAVAYDPEDEVPEPTLLANKRFSLTQTFNITGVALCG